MFNGTCDCGAALNNRLECYACKEPPVPQMQRAHEVETGPPKRDGRCRHNRPYGSVCIACVNQPGRSRPIGPRNFQ